MARRNRDRLPDFWRQGQPPRGPRVEGPWVGQAAAAAQPHRDGRYLLRASSPQFFGVRAGVQFDRGEGRTSDLSRARACEEMGFELIDTAAAQAGNAGPETAAGGAGVNSADDRAGDAGDAAAGQGEGV